MHSYMHSMYMHTYINTDTTQRVYRCAFLFITVSERLSIVVSTWLLEMQLKLTNRMLYSICCLNSVTLVRPRSPSSQQDFLASEEATEISNQLNIISRTMLS